MHRGRDRRPGTGGVVSASGQLVLLRHGQSLWNDQRRFTGWADPPLAVSGQTEATAAAGALRVMNVRLDLVITSVLRRATQTVDVLLAAGLTATDVVVDWRLNERHYGTLEGLTHAEGEARFGPRRVAAWRRSWDVCPPPLDRFDPRHPAAQRQYQQIPAELLPSAESLQQCLARSWPAMLEHALPELQRGGTVLLVGHGNQLRALVAILDQLDPQQIQGLVLPTGVPRPYLLSHGQWQRQPSPLISGTLSGP